MKKILIVKDGSFGLLSAEKGDYDSLIESIIRSLNESAKRLHRGTKIKVLNKGDDVAMNIANGEGDMVIFLSRSMIKCARDLKIQFPRTEIFVLTGLIPENEVVILNKLWLSPEMIENMAFS